MKRLILLLLLVTTNHLYAQQHTLPRWFTQAFNKQSLDKKYLLRTYHKLTFLEADFNGDGVKDVVAMILEKKSQKIGLLLIHGSTNKVTVFGAGVKVGKPGFDDSDDLKWIDGWEVYKEKVAYETKFDNGDIIGSIKRRLINKAISIWENQDGAPLAGGLITWNGKKYIWIHQGE